MPVTIGTGDDAQSQWTAGTSAQGHVTGLTAAGVLGAEVGEVSVLGRPEEIIVDPNQGHLLEIEENQDLEAGARLIPGEMDEDQEVEIDRRDIVDRTGEMMTTEREGREAKV